MNYWKEYNRLSDQIKHLEKAREGGEETATYQIIQIRNESREVLRSAILEIFLKIDSCKTFLRDVKLTSGWGRLWGFYKGSERSDDILPCIYDKEKVWDGEDIEFKLFLYGDAEELLHKGVRYLKLEIVPRRFEPIVRLCILKSDLENTDGVISRMAKKQKRKEEIEANSLLKKLEDCNKRILLCDELIEQ